MDLLETLRELVRKLYHDITGVDSNTVPRNDPRSMQIDAFRHFLTSAYVTLE